MSPSAEALLHFHRTYGRHLRGQDTPDDAIIEARIAALSDTDAARCLSYLRRLNRGWPL